MTENHDERENPSVERLNPLNDFAFQKTFGEKGDEAQTLEFLNAVLERTGKGNLSSVEIIEAKDLPAESVGEKTGRLDVLAKLSDGSKANVEVQNKNEHNMEKRSLFYWAKKYIEGLKKGGEYIDLVPVIAINIIDFDYIDIDDFHTSFHLWDDLHKEFKLSDVCEIHFLNMAKFRKLRSRGDGGFSLENPLHRWLAWFDENSSKELIEEVLKMDMAIKTAQSTMDLIARDPALRRAYEQYEKADLDFRSGMGDARREGERIGEQKGERIGRQEERQEVALNMKADNMPVSQIIKYTGLSDQDILSL
jgi:predicted transposase/invertase (TIGR01784 family)